MSEERRETLRLDRVLVYLRFVRTRSLAQALVEAGHMRVNGERVAKCSRDICAGDVLTLARSGDVVVARIEHLPRRRLAPAEAARSWTRLV